jgi:hypothetical protein
MTTDCSDEKCGALDLVLKAKSLTPQQIESTDSRHPGAKACEALGGTTTVVSSEKTKDQLCLCIASDSSGISCSRIRLY